MRLRTILAGGGLAGTAVLVGACLSTSEPRVVDDVQEARSLIMSEHVGEAAQPSAKGAACRAYCATSYATACWRVTQACVGAEVITLGGATIACSAAIGAVCLSSVALASLCNESCPP